jgi:FkbM family methyltransferase
MSEFVDHCKDLLSTLGLKGVAKKVYNRLNRVMGKVKARSIVSGPVKFKIPDRESNERIKYAYYANNQALVDVHYGAVLLLNLDDNSVAPTIMRTGWWEPWTDILINSIVKEGNITIDVGANFGYHTLLQAKLVGTQGKVYAFECNPLLIPNLIRSAWISGFSGRIALHHAAVTDKMGEIDIHFCRQQIGGGGIRVGAPTGPQYSFNEHGRVDWNTCWSEIEHVSVKTVGLDALLGQEIGEVDFIHTDAEGAEPLIFAGAKEIIKRSRHLKIITEWSIESASEQDKPAHYQMAKGLADEGFKFYLIKPPEQDVYSFPPILKRMDLDEVMRLPHCDLFITRE